MNFLDGHLFPENQDPLVITALMGQERAALCFTSPPYGSQRNYTDAIADWVYLNFALNAIGGASWVSLHHGGGVGMGFSLHAGMVVVADGTPGAEARLGRVLTYDPMMGILRHADAGYERAQDNAEKFGIKIPLLHSNR